MRVTLCSIFRDSAAYVHRYLLQVQGLRETMDVRLVVTEGDSSDTTYEDLASSGVEMELHRFDHGGPRFASIDHPQRWDQIAKAVRFTLDQVGDPGDALIWVESDLIWQPNTLHALTNDLLLEPAVAPMVMADGEERFYDIWGFRRDGIPFSPGHPFYTQSSPYGADGLVKIDSCGSCWATNDDWWRTWSGHWPYTAGGELWLDPTLRIWHP